MYFKDEDFEKSIKILHEKKNCCGIDDIFINQFDDFWQLNKDTIISQINSNSYKQAICSDTGRNCYESREKATNIKIYVYR